MAWPISARAAVPYTAISDSRRNASAYISISLGCVTLSQPDTSSTLTSVSSNRKNISTGRSSDLSASNGIMPSVTDGSDIAMSLPSVTLGIIPFDADRSLLRPVEMFFLFDDTEVSVELVSGWLRVTQPSEIEMYAEAFRRLSEMAVYGTAARALIGQAIEAIS